MHKSEWSEPVYPGPAARQRPLPFRMSIPPHKEFRRMLYVRTDVRGRRPSRGGPVPGGTRADGSGRAPASASRRLPAVRPTLSNAVNGRAMSG